jgi:hypothetical protein
VFSGSVNVISVRVKEEDYMTAKKFLIYFLILILTSYPASAGDVSLNRWVLNVTLHDDGLVEEVIQAEIENSGSLPLDGFSFIVPASKVTIGKNDIVSIPAIGQEVSQQTVPDGVKVIINFNTPVGAGKKWDGRIGFTAENWAVKENSNYSVDIPVEAPQAVVSGKNIGMSVPPEAEIRSQVFLPKAVNAASIEVKSKEPAPYKKLLQFGRVVLTWFQLHTGDVISVKGSYSEILRQIVETDEKSRSLSARIKEAKAQGRDVSEADAHLRNAEDYNNNQALQSFWKNDNKVALEYVGYANDELAKAENSLKVEAKETPQTTGAKKIPWLGAAGMFLILLISFVVKKKK